MGSIPVSRSKKTVPNVYVSELFFFPPPPPIRHLPSGFLFYKPPAHTARAACMEKARSAKRSTPCFLLSVCYAPMLVRSL